VKYVIGYITECIRLSSNLGSHNPPNIKNHSTSNMDPCRMRDDRVCANVCVFILPECLASAASACDCDVAMVPEEWVYPHGSRSFEK